MGLFDKIEKQVKKVSQKVEKQTRSGFNSALNLGIDKPLELVSRPLNTLGSSLTPEGKQLLASGGGVAGAATGLPFAGLFSGLSGFMGGDSQPAPSSSPGGLFTGYTPEAQPAVTGGLPGWAIPAAIGGGVLILVLALRK